jgi:adenosylhomocysteine nucleosidase
MSPPDMIVAVTGLAFEAGIAAGPGVTVLTGDSANREAIADAVSRGCRGIISFGIAGGLASHLKPGACIVARSIVMGDQRFHSNPEWSERLLRIIPGSIHGDIAGADTPVWCPGHKREMGDATGAVAVDMESAVSAIAAVHHNLPFAAVRVVADPSHRGLPPAALGPRMADGTTDLSAVWRSIVAQPNQLGALIRLAFDTRTARSVLVRSRRLIGPGFGFIDLSAVPVAQAE